MEWKLILIGLVLLSFSALAQAAYNPYINNGYSRPYYTQFYSLPGVSRVGQIYYGTNINTTSYSNGWENYSETYVQNGANCWSCYSNYYYYRSPATFTAPTYSLPTAAYSVPTYYRAGFGFSFRYYN